MLKRKASVTIGPDNDGQRLLDFLVFRFTYQDRAGWKKALAQARMLVDGRCACEEQVLRTGQTVEYLVPDVPEPTVNTAIRFLRQEAGLLAVDKPPNLPCHPAGRYFQHTLWMILKQCGVPNPALVNRLDRETSGIVLVASSPWMARSCSKLFTQREVRKEYLVLVEGRFPGALTADGWLLRDAESSVRKKRRFLMGPRPRCAEAKRVRTHFARQAHGGGISLVKALPETGRYHQIRASLNSLGFPVVGDKLYGVDETAFLRFISGELTPADRRRLRLERQALHAAALSLTHPLTLRSLRWHSRLPPDMAAIADAM